MSERGTDAELELGPQLARFRDERFPRGLLRHILRGLSGSAFLHQEQLRKTCTQYFDGLHRESARALTWVRLVARQVQMEVAPSTRSEIHRSTNGTLACSGRTTMTAVALLSPAVRSISSRGRARASRSTTLT